jgi:fructokinase
VKNNFVMTRNIFTIGETVYDIIFENGEIASGKAGGAMLNSSVSLGRTGCNVSLITELGNDDLGKHILEFLSVNHVNTNFINQFKDGKTPVALAFLDEQKNASYSFYKQYPAQRMQQPFPEIQLDDIVLFGSFFGVNPDVRDRVKEFVQAAKDAGAIIIYDPNIRHPKDHGMEKIIPAVLENFAFADIIRASNEDFLNLFDIDNPEEAHRLIKEYSGAGLIYTHSSDFVFVGSSGYLNRFPVPKIKVVSTIGAGDNFNAGVIYSLLQQGITKYNLQSLDKTTWQNIITSGIRFSAAVCRSWDNYVPQGFLNGQTR